MVSDYAKSSFDEKDDNTCTDHTATRKIKLGICKILQALEWVWGWVCHASNMEKKCTEYCTEWPAETGKHF